MEKKTKPKKLSEDSQKQESAGKAGFRKYPEKTKEQVIQWHKEGKKKCWVVTNSGEDFLMEMEKNAKSSLLLMKVFIECVTLIKQLFFL